MIKVDEKILKAVDEREGELVELAKQYLRFETCNPPGGNEGPAQRWVAERMREIGLDVRVFDALPDRPNVVGVYHGSGGGRSLILNGHVDVAEVPLRETWSHDPFHPVVKGRQLYGRGASDMKSALIGYLGALDVLHKAGYKLKGDVIVENVIGEEKGEPGTRRCIEEGYRADFAIVGECASARRIHPTIGVMNGCIHLTMPFSIHLVARRFYSQAGGATEGVNLIEKMATKIIPALNDLEREWVVHKRHPLVPHGQTVINCFRIEGGGNQFFMPDCTLYFTVIYLPDEKKEEVQQQVEERIHAVAAGDGWLRKHPPVIAWIPPEYPIQFMPTDIDVESEPVQLLAECIKAATGEKEVEIGGRGGITDSGWLYNAGIPSVVYGPGTVYYAHRVDELLEIDDLMAYTKGLALFLLNWCGH